MRGVRSHVFQGLTAAAAHGHLELQRCMRCEAVQYPPREACHRCLSTQLQWTVQSGVGELLAHTMVFHSYEPYFQDRGPWRIGLVQLECGPILMAYVHAAVVPAPARVRVVACLDRSAQAVLIALPEGSSAAPRDDEKLRGILLPPAAQAGAEEGS